MAFPICTTCFLFNIPYSQSVYILEKILILDRLNFGKIEFGENQILRKVYLVANAFIHIKFDTNCILGCLLFRVLFRYMKTSLHLI